MGQTIFRGLFMYRGLAFLCGIPPGSPVSFHLQKHTDRCTGYDKLPQGMNERANVNVSVRGSLWWTGVPLTVYSRVTARPLPPGHVLFMDLKMRSTRIPKLPKWQGFHFYFHRHFHYSLCVHPILLSCPQRPLFWKVGSPECIPSWG